MFEGFTLETVDVGPVRLRVRHGGSGTPVVLVHGHPRTHTTWHRVAPRLADDHFVVCPDLRGYGRSTLPADEPGHAQSAKRAMAGDIVSLMRHLGHERFSVVGHDRGALVAFRTAMDHPDVVDRLVVMDGLPITEHLERLNEDFVRTWWHWWFLAQTDKPAERVINSAPEAWYRTPGPHEVGEANHADIWAALRDPAVVHGMCEDYRAGLRIDRVHEEADRAAGRQVRCPTLLLAATEDDIDIHGDPLTIWRPWVAGELRGVDVHSGHHQAEQAPGEVARAIGEFLRAT
ncbi:alpha/beta fold hydrolase [Amycolatopsis saalfeldensis]|uniref:Haloacetate dehalogenase n=1 Tax=Amycolatopsis saalfeldensis TaxID=394193 RepID=A0A1H8XBX0_9PSEU|nr:alpha/beta hydrolase [Amycolatopsis saalfeldensis]SEP37445.1 haloacetate dehalogenase [Amycolatopsis saalfeldensis]